MKSTKGGCLCGQVRFEARGEPMEVGLCHCLDCRKYHGALFWAGAMFAPENFRVTGEVKEYQSRFFCPHCGSSVYAELHGEIEVYLGALDEPNQFTPSYELWTIRREAFLPEFTGLKRFARDRD